MHFYLSKEELKKNEEEAKQFQEKLATPEGRAELKKDKDLQEVLQFMQNAKKETTEEKKLKPRQGQSSKRTLEYMRKENLLPSEKKAEEPTKPQSKA